MGVLVVAGAFVRVREAVLRGLRLRVVAAVPSPVAEPAATALRLGSLTAPLRAAGFVSVPGSDPAEVEVTGFEAAGFATAGFEAADFATAGFEAAGFEAAARADAGSAAATDGLSEQSVFWRGAGIGPGVGEPAAGASVGNHGGLPDSGGAIQGARGRCHFKCTTLAL